MKKPWKCDVCSYVVNTKKELVEELLNHWNDGQQEVDEAEYQLEELGIKEPWRY